MVTREQIEKIRQMVKDDEKVREATSVPELDALCDAALAGADLDERIALMQICRDQAVTLAGGPDAVQDGRPVTTAVTMYRVWLQAIGIMTRDRSQAS